MGSKIYSETNPDCCGSERQADYSCFHNGFEKNCISAVGIELGEFLEKERVLRKEIKSNIHFEISNKVACIVLYELLLQ